MGMSSSVPGQVIALLGYNKWTGMATPPIGLVRLQEFWPKLRKTTVCVPAQLKKYPALGAGTQRRRSETAVMILSAAKSADELGGNVARSRCCYILTLIDCIDGLSEHGSAAASPRYRQRRTLTSAGSGSWLKDSSTCPLLEAPANKA